MPGDLKGKRLDLRVEDRLFSDPEVRAVLDDLTYDEMREQFGQPYIDTHYASAPGWDPGTGRPHLADEHPEVMQAVGRCAASRLRNDAKIAALGRAHPRPCGWCGYPLADLLAACSWAVWSSGLILSETVTWAGANRSHYTRSGRANEYLNPAHAAFWSLPEGERLALVEAAIEWSRV